MQKYLHLTCLDAIDPIPKLGAKIDRSLTACKKPWNDKWWADRLFEEGDKTPKVVKDPCWEQGGTVTGRYAAKIGSTLEEIPKASLKQPVKDFGLRTADTALLGINPALKYTADYAIPVKGETALTKWQASVALTLGIVGVENHLRTSGTKDRELTLALWSDLLFDWRRGLRPKVPHAWEEELMCAARLGIVYMQRVVAFDSILVQRADQKKLILKMNRLGLQVRRYMANRLPFKGSVYGNPCSDDL